MDGAEDARGLEEVLNQRSQLLKKAMKGSVFLGTWELVIPLLVSRPAAIGSPGKLSFHWLEIPAVQLQNTSV